MKHVEPRCVVQLKRPTLTGDATKVQALNLLSPFFKRIQMLNNVLAVWGKQPLHLAFGIGGLKDRICVLKALCQKQMLQQQNFSHVTFEACLLTFPLPFLHRIRYVWSDRCSTERNILYQPQLVCPSRCPWSNSRTAISCTVSKQQTYASPPGFCR